MPYFTYEWQERLPRSPVAVPGVGTLAVGGSLVDAGLAKPVCWEQAGSRASTARYARATGGQISRHGHA